MVNYFLFSKFFFNLISTIFHVKALLRGNLRVLTEKQLNSTNVLFCIYHSHYSIFIAQSSKLAGDRDRACIIVSIFKIYRSDSSFHTTERNNNNITKFFRRYCFLTSLYGVWIQLNWFSVSGSLLGSFSKACHNRVVGFIRVSKQEGKEQCKRRGKKKRERKRRKK